MDGCWSGRSWRDSIEPQETEPEVRDRDYESCGSSSDFEPFSSDDDYSEDEMSALDLSLFEPRPESAASCCSCCMCPCPRCRPSCPYCNEYEYGLTTPALRPNIYVLNYPEGNYFFKTIFMCPSN